MEFLELALNPRRANLRFSPFSNALPPGMARRLEYVFGDRAAAWDDERAVYSRDLGGAPGAVDKLLKRDAWAVVKPQVRGDLFDILKFANDTSVPVTPRGGGTSLYGGATPTEGGVVVDMRDFKRVVYVDKAARTVTVEPGLTFNALDRVLAPEGLALRQRALLPGATLGGYLAEGGAGIGSPKYGRFRDDVVEAVLVGPDGVERTLKGDDLDLVDGAHGTTGFIVQLTLKLRERGEESCVLGSFDDAPSAAKALAALAKLPNLHGYQLFDSAFAEQVNDAQRARHFPAGKFSILAAYEGPAPADAEKAIKDAGGAAGKVEDAKRLWDLRFGAHSVKRLGPGLALAEIVLPLDRLGEAIGKARDALRAGTTAFTALAVSASEVKLTFSALEDETRLEYVFQSGNGLAFVDAMRKLGGRPYSTGVMQAGEARRVLGKERFARLRVFKAETDGREVMNPGPVFGARVRGMPIRAFPFVLRAGAPMMKMMRGTTHHYEGGEKQDVGARAAAITMGRARAGDVGLVAYEASTCSFCGACNDVSPTAHRSVLESGMPRGRVELANVINRGKAAPDRHTYESIIQTPLSRIEDAVCPSLIPISRVTDLLISAYVDAHGAHPGHAVLAMNAREHGNVLGKPRDKRSAWVNVPFTSEPINLFLADDAGAYEAMDVVKSAAAALVNAGTDLSHLGKAEVTSGATLVETGQRDAFHEVVAPMLEEIDKRKPLSVVSPDANALRAIRNDWPLALERARLDWRPEVVQHTTTILAAAVKAKRLVLEKPFEKKLVIHVPEAFDAADEKGFLDLAKAIPGATVVDAPHKDCGHGRALEAVNADLQSEVAEACLKNALAAGAEAILTASPGCFALLSKVAKKAKAAIEIHDIHVVVAQSMKMAEGGAAVAVAAPSQAEETMVEPEIPADHFRVEFVKERTVLAVNKNKTILDAAEEAGLELPSSCRAGSCDTCSAKWEGTASDQSAGAALTPDQQKTYVLTCIARPKGPIKIWSDERP